MADEPTGAATFPDLIDLAAERVGGKALATSDDFFAGMENLLKEGRGVFLPDEYTDRGKWMDGWESRRKREPGHDWCVIRLGLPGQISGIDVDTNHFLGNHPAFASMEATSIEGEPDLDTLLGPGAGWEPLMAQAPLRRGSQNLFCVRSAARVTHVRLNIFPDGGVARLRCYGRVAADLSGDGERDMAGLVNGGRVIACNDMFFGNMQNLIMPHEGVNMGDGWETRRKRDKSEDWVIVELGARTRLTRLLVHTRHFKGNFPDTCAVDGLDCSRKPLLLYSGEERDWVEVLPHQKLTADAEHVYTDQIQARGPFTHLRLRIFPDGGVSRLRAFGVPDPA